MKEIKLKSSNSAFIKDDLGIDPDQPNILISSDQTSKNHTCQLVPIDYGLKNIKNRKSTYAKINRIKIINNFFEVSICKFCRKIYIYSLEGIINDQNSLTLMALEYESKDIPHLPRGKKCPSDHSTLSPTYMRINTARIPLIYRFCQTCENLYKFDQHCELINISTQDMSI